MPKLWDGGFMKRSSRPCVAVELSKPLTHQLNMYALAAGASGVGLLALAPPAEAKIIYTPAHIIGPWFNLDLNHDGIVDFNFVTFGNASTRFWFVCQYLNSDTGAYCSFSGGTNAVRTIQSRYGANAAALRYGDKVQRGRFAKGHATLGRVLIGTGLDTTWRGPWFNEGK